MKTHDKFATQASVSGDDTASSSRKVPTVEDKAKAEALKQEGNSLMTAKKFDSAIEAYTQAITLDATNPVYYSNRAAAYSSKSDHISAISDANKAIEVDPRYSKGYHRLGYEYHLYQSPWVFTFTCDYSVMHFIRLVTSKLLQMPSNVVLRSNLLILA